MQDFEQQLQQLVDHKTNPAGSLGRLLIARIPAIEGGLKNTPCGDLPGSLTCPNSWAH